MAQPDLRGLGELFVVESLPLFGGTSSQLKGSGAMAVLRDLLRGTLVQPEELRRFYNLDEDALKLCSAEFCSLLEGSTCDESGRIPTFEARPVLVTWVVAW